MKTPLLTGLLLVGLLLSGCATRPSKPDAVDQPVDESLPAREARILIELEWLSPTNHVEVIDYLGISPSPGDCHDIPMAAIHDHTDPAEWKKQSAKGLTPGKVCAIEVVAKKKKGEPPATDSPTPQEPDDAQGSDPGHSDPGDPAAPLVPGPT